MLMANDSPSVRIALFFGCAVLFIVCDVLAANWGKNNSQASLVALLLVAPLAYVVFGYLNEQHALSVVSAWIVLVVCVSSVLLGLFVFDDQLTAKQGAGVALAIVAGALLLF